MSRPNGRQPKTKKPQRGNAEASGNENTLQGYRHEQY